MDEPTYRELEDRSLSAARGRREDKVVVRLEDYWKALRLHGVEKREAEDGTETVWQFSCGDKLDALHNRCSSRYSSTHVIGTRAWLWPWLCVAAGGLPGA